MRIPFRKLHPDAKEPVFGGPLEAGADLTAVSVEYDKKTSTYWFGTGIAVAIPRGHVGLIFPRSSVYKQELRLSNCVGVVDSSYRGEIMARFDLRGWGKVLGLVFHYFPFLMEVWPTYPKYTIGDRIMQLVIIKYETPTYEESEELDETYRGDKGFGELTGNE